MRPSPTPTPFSSPVTSFAPFGVTLRPPRRPGLVARKAATTRASRAGVASHFRSATGDCQKKTLPQNAVELRRRREVMIQQHTVMAVAMGGEVMCAAPCMFHS